MSVSLSFVSTAVIDCYPNVVHIFVLSPNYNVDITFYVAMVMLGGGGICVASMMSPSIA